MEPGPSSTSDYFRGLDWTAKQRYKEKHVELGELEDPHLRCGQGITPTLKGSREENQGSSTFQDVCVCVHWLFF